MGQHQLHEPERTSWGIPLLCLAGLIVCALLLIFGA
jgi:hypothetical protein